MAIIDSIISHQIWLQRNASSQVKELAPFIEKMRKEVRNQVLAFGDDARTRANLQKMLTELEAKLKEISTDWESDLLDYVQELGAYEAEWTAKTLGENTSVSFKVPAAAQVYAAIKFNPLNLSNKPSDLTALTAGWRDTEVSRLITGVKTGFVYGNTTRQIVKEVVGAGGFADISERNAATVIRTVLNHVSNQARELTYERNKDIITGYQWISTLDSRTSTICKGYDHQKYEIGKGPLPPAHPNCRSTTIPLVDSDLDFLDEGATRASRGADGGEPISADISYYEFLKRQPAFFQDEALGPVRGKIFRNSGISPEEFRTISTDGFGRPLTLTEMAALDKRVAEYLRNI